MKQIEASIITIGDELLIGQTIDTNSAFIAQELNKIGIWVKRRVAIADDKAAILKTLAVEGKESSIVIITGGLGPTADDITKPTLCEYFKTKLVVDEGVLQNVTEIFQKLGRPMIERNAKQAEVPESCVVLPNRRGTAPGMWFGPPAPQEGIPDAQPLTDAVNSQSAGLNTAKARDNSSQKQESAAAFHSLQSGLSSAGAPSLSEEGRDEAYSRTGSREAGPIYISLPGVPHEMKGLMLDSVIPKLKETFTLPAVVHRTLLTAGQGESFVAERLAGFEAALPPFIKLAYLPAYGMVRLRLTGKGDDQNTIATAVDEAFENLQLLVKEWMIIDKDVTLAEAISKLLKEENKTLATAESCTGGYIAHLITSLPGASSFFYGSVVSYANRAKETVLHVAPQTLAEHGAVSEQTVCQMATGACTLLQTDYAVATSGIMGPDGGSAGKPVGTVWIAVAGKTGVVKAQKFRFHFDRTRNIHHAANAALLLLRSVVLAETKG
jgi:nicotinamide-nucleotide amidase